jgi:hypothetical protein
MINNFILFIGASLLINTFQTHESDILGCDDFLGLHMFTILILGNNNNKSSSLIAIFLPIKPLYKIRVTKKSKGRLCG